ncbi:MAG TPA: lipid-A-disaccharide synthase [Acidobacteriota bacterium]|nr:lipid-A-disaccharide synthase [Acidobacteriota bacterium]
MAGEASADRYGARLVRRLRARRGKGTIYFYGTGGDEMRAAGVDLVAHVRDLAHIGPREAVAHFRRYLATFRRLVRSSVEHPPELAILLDFPEFNLRLAKKMKRAGIKVIYYISPQLWAWRRGRIRTVRNYVDKMLVILPFEEAFYREHGIEVEFVGHPLLEDFSPRYDRVAFLRGMGLEPEVKTIAILPGSRRKEIDYILPTLLRAAQLILRSCPAQFLISVAPTVDEDQLRRVAGGILQGNPNAGCFRMAKAASRDVLANSDFAFVKSGTSTLEAALVGKPFVIIYKISPISWWFGNLLVHSSLKGLVNLIAKEEIVPEYLQQDANPDALAKVALEFLREPKRAEAMKTRLADIREMLSVRCASDSVAAAVETYL